MSRPACRLSTIRMLEEACDFLPYEMLTKSIEDDADV
jgi:hypothetical protein